MEQIILNLVPGGVSPVCYVSQYDVGRKIRLHLRNGSDPYVLSGAETINATIRKVSGEELIYDIANTSTSYVDLIVNYDATDVIGESVCELIITESGTRLGSANFKMRIDPDVYSGDQKLEVVTASSPDSLLSFETNIDENLLELKASLAPVQNGTPWIDSNEINREPYIKRAVAGTASRIGNHLYDKLVGGTVAFNQNIAATSGNQSTVSELSDGVYKATSNGNASYFGFGLLDGSNAIFKPIVGHKYYLRFNLVDFSISNANILSSGNGINSTYTPTVGIKEKVIQASANVATYINFSTNGTSLATDNFTIKDVNIIDLTAMFGSTIADYIYGLEQATAGAGVAWFKTLFPNDYYAYDAGSLKSVKTSAHITRGFNQWDEVAELGSINTNNGQEVPSNSRLRSKNYMPVIAGLSYYFSTQTSGPDYYIVPVFYDKDYNYVGRITYGVYSPKSTNSAEYQNPFVVPDKACYMRFIISDAYGSSYKNDICINLSDLSRNGEYEPYVIHSYALDPDLELRGIPKLDANNNLYYDGDTYESNGNVTRKYKKIDLSTMNWSNITSISNYSYVIMDDRKEGANINYIVNQLPTSIKRALMNSANKGFVLEFETGTFSSTEELKTALANSKLVYELATPTTEQASPFTNPQVCDENGTEEYTDSRAVAIPVGHETYQANICPINGYSSANITRCGVNLFDALTWVTLGVNSRFYSVSSSQEITITGNDVSGIGNRLFNVIPNATYSYMSTFSSEIRIFDSNGETISNLTSGTFTAPADGRIAIKFYANSYPTTGMFILVLGSTIPSEFSPYNGQTYTIAFGQTVYGGVLDVTRGKLHVTHGYADLGTLNYTYYSGLLRFAYRLDDGKPSGTAFGLDTALCECYPVSSVQYSNMPDDSIMVGSNFFSGSVGSIVIHDESYTSVPAIQTALSGQIVVYELATPFDIDLTPVQISALVGENNVLSDANGGTEVKFFRLIPAS